MNKQLTCIECPAGCKLSVTSDNGKVVSVSGNNCPKGEAYAAAEIENPLRILTATVATVGLQLKMVAVRTDKPIPKSRMLEAMQEVKKIKLAYPVKAGDVIVEKFLGMKVNLIAARESLKG